MCVHRDFISCLFPLVPEADWNFFASVKHSFILPMTFQWSSVWVCERKQNYKYAAAAFAVAGSCILSQNVLKKKILINVKHEKKKKRYSSAHTPTI